MLGGPSVPVIGMTATWPNQWLAPVIVGAPWALRGLLGYRLARASVRRVRRSRG